MNKKIFICDDNLAILEALVMILGITEAMVVGESKSAKALNYIINEKPNIFICDLQMPGLNGEGLIKQIRAHNELNELFILCISAFDEGRDIAINAGADYFLPKPFEINELLAVVNRVLAAGTC
ncbi:MAG: divK 1 [Sphingobacterium sp.]|jgi:DNA-binding response OmpR family regulator|nr:divK 1 [Sphingobacterium sp.]